MDAALAAALKAARIDPGKIVSLGVSGQQHGFVPLDAKGRPIRPAKLWNDTSTIRETEETRRRARRQERLHRPAGHRLGRRLHRLEDPLAQEERAEPLREARDRPPPPQLSELPPDRPGRIWNTATHRGRGSWTSAGSVGTRRPSGRRRGPRGEAPAAQPSPRARRPGEEELGRALRPRPGPRRERRRRQHDGRDRHRQRRSRRLHAQPGDVGDGLLAFRPAVRRPRGRDRRLLRQHGRLAAAPLHDERDQHDGDRQIALRPRQRQAREAGAAGRGRARTASSSFPSSTASGCPSSPPRARVFFGLDRKTFDAAHIVRAVMEGTILNLGYGFARMKELGLRPTEIRATGGGAQEPAVAPDRRRRLRDARRDAAGARGRGLRGGPSIHLELAPDPGREGGHRRYRGPAWDGQRHELGGESADPSNAELLSRTLQDRFNDLWRTPRARFRSPTSKL